MNQVQLGVNKIIQEASIKAEIKSAAKNIRTLHLSLIEEGYTAQEAMEIVIRLSTAPRQTGEEQP
jgi:hypothetical protein